MKNKKKYIRNSVIFILIISGFSLFYNYPEILFKRPQSIHNWRQCDGASLALNYYQEGMHFFKPQSHLLYSDNYTTGYASPSEVPILYYFIAFLYKIFGYHEFIFRTVNLLIFFIGLFYVYKLGMIMLNDNILSLITVALLFSSPLIVYYANNFLPNTVALSFSFIGWYYFYQYSQNLKLKTFLISILFFEIAAALKITELSGPIIILGLLIIDKYHIVKLNLAAEKQFWLKISGIFLIFVITAFWVIYAKYYNNLHGSNLFSTFTFPIWNLSSDDIKIIFHKMNVLWLTDYYHSATLYFFSGCLIFLMFFYRRTNKILLLSIFAIIFGLLLYSLLWFEALGDHDYFLISFYTIFVFLFLGSSLILKSFQFKPVYLNIIKVVLIAFVIFNVFHARERQLRRYDTLWINDYKEMKDIYTATSFLNNNSINYRDSVIFYPSYSVRPLYLMDVKGWVIGNDATDSSTIERDNKLMKLYISKGADYFITNNLNMALKNPSLAPYLNELYFRYNNLFVFKVSPEY